MPGASAIKLFGHIHYSFGCCKLPPSPSFAIKAEPLSKWGEVKTTYAFSAFLMPFPSNFRFAWYQQAGEGGCYDTLAELYGERIRCFTLTRQND
jgi:hypothetical protein